RKAIQKKGQSQTSAAGASCAESAQPACHATRHSVSPSRTRERALLSPQARRLLGILRNQILSRCAPEKAPPPGVDVMRNSFWKVSYLLWFTAFSACSGGGGGGTGGSGGATGGSGGATGGTGGVGGTGNGGTGNGGTGGTSQLAECPIP